MKEKTKMRKKLEAKGITLIALIITIIVMLILVAVTVSVALNGGLIGKAQEAKTKTEKAQIQERDLLTGRIKIGDTWYDSLDEYLKNNPSENQSDETSDVQGVEIGGTAEWEQDDEGNIKYKGQSSGLKIGDFVDYGEFVKISNNGNEEDISELYGDLEKYAGVRGDYSKTAYPITKEDLKWRVLDIKDGKIRLISSNSARSVVCLEDYNGYNNGVYLIDKMCRVLYSTDIGISQNLKIEDVQNLMDLSVQDYHDYNNYGVANEFTENNSYYPEIFAKEKNGWVNDVQGTELDVSEQTTPVLQNAKLPASPTKDDKIKVTNTYWCYSMSKSLWKNPAYEDLLMMDYDEHFATNHWLSSRTTTAIGDYADFGLYVFQWGQVMKHDLYYSRNVGQNTSYSIRPVVTLDPAVSLELSAGSAEDPHLIRWYGNK